MGYIRHHTIVVVGDTEHEAFGAAYHHAVAIFGQERVSPMMGPFTNLYGSFFIAPDGSKEGWSESNENDKKRAEFMAYLRLHGGGNAIEATIGDEAGAAVIVSEY